jgi:hypothetical protein
MSRLISKIIRTLLMIVVGAVISPAPHSQTPSPLQKSSVIYGIESDGTLNWYRHDGAGTGTGLETPGAWIGKKTVDSGWSEYTRVFPGGADIIYGIKTDGTLEWRKHRGFASGTALWEPPKNVGRGWDGFVDVFSGGDGVIYVIQADGTLKWYRHLAYRTGEGLETPGAWATSRNVGRGWDGYKKVFSGGKGVIYAITNDGTLKWLRHKAYLTGEGLETRGAWEGPKDVGRGWGDVEKVFSSGDGVIYTITQDGKLWWIRHYAYMDGRGLESSNAWSARKEVGRGWTDPVNVFALMPFNDSETSEAGAPGVDSRDTAVLTGRPGGIDNSNTEPSNEILCRGTQSKVLLLFWTRSSRLDSTGASVVTLELGTSGGPVAAGSNGMALQPGQCAWRDRPLDHPPYGIRFEAAANGQLKQQLQGVPIDTSPTAAETFPDAANIAAYLKDERHYWSFFVSDSGNGYLQATSSKYFKPTPGLSDTFTRPPGNRHVEGRRRAPNPRP